MAVKKPKRPTEFDPDLFDEILERLAQGDTLKYITGRPKYPTAHTWRKWLGEYPERQAAAQLARELGAEMLADEIIDIADNEDDSAKARNMIEARKWRAATIKPTTYGNKTQIDVTHRVDHASAHAAALERKKAMLLSSPNVIDGQVIDIIEDEAQRASDSVSPVQDEDAD